MAGNNEGLSYGVPRATPKRGTLPKIIIVKKTAPKDGWESQQKSQETGGEQPMIKPARAPAKVTALKAASM